MTITNGYATLDEFKARFFPADIIDTIDDAAMEAVIESVSRWIDDYCFRRFWKNTVAEARYYTAEWGDLLYTDDIVSISSLKTDEDGDRTYERTWQTTDYDLEPYNAGLENPVKPYTIIRTSPKGNYSFPTSRKAVEITGVFGWYAVPKKISEACLMQASRIFKRKDAPLGVTGSYETGVLRLVSEFDPDVKQLLESFRKLSAEGI